MVGGVLLLHVLSVLLLSLLLSRSIKLWNAVHIMSTRAYNVTYTTYEIKKLYLEVEKVPNTKVPNCVGFTEYKNLIIF